MVAFVIVLEILLPTVVLGCFRRRKYMEMLAIKIIRSILTLPFLFWVVQAHLTIIKMINDMILSGYFLQDRTIVFGGAFDQPGLFKQGVLMFSERSEGRAKRGDSPKGRAGRERGDPMRENCTYGSMRGIRRKTAKHVLRVAEGRAGVPDNKGRPTLLYTLQFAV